MSPVITKLYCRRWVSRCQGNLAWRPSSGSWRGSGQIGILWPCIGCKGVWEVQEKCQRKDVEVLSYRWEVPTEVVWSLYFQGSSWGQKEKGSINNSFPTSHTGGGTIMWQEVGLYLWNITICSCSCSCSKIMRTEWGYSCRFYVNTFPVL